MSTDTPTSEIAKTETAVVVPSEIANPFDSALSVDPQEFFFKIQDKQKVIHDCVLVELTGPVWDEYQNARFNNFKWTQPPAGATDAEKEAFVSKLETVDHRGVEEVAIAGCLFECFLINPADPTQGETKPRRQFGVDEIKKLPYKTRQVIHLKLTEMSAADVDYQKAIKQAKNA